MPFARALLSTLALTAGAVAVASPALAAVTTDVPPDTTPPALVSVAASPAPANTTAGPATVVVSARLADVGTGVASAQVRLGSADAAPFRLSLLTGDGHDGVWTAEATVPAFTAHGPLAAYVAATDATGNAATLVDTDAVTVADLPPAAPHDVAVTASSPAVVTWTPPASTGVSPIESYEVSVTPAPAGTPAPSAVSVPADAREASLGDLTEGTRYVVRVAARNAVGLGLAATADVVPGQAATTVPGVPPIVDATPHDRSVEVRWAPPASDGGGPVTAYEIRTAASPDPLRVDPGQTSAVVPGLTNGTPYDVTVNAVNAVGAGPAASVRVTPRTVPGAPRITNAVAYDGAASVYWTAPASDGGDPIRMYVVTATPGGTYVMPGTTHAVRLAGMANGVRTSFTVTAVNGAGPGPHSAASAAVTPRQPAHLAVVTPPARTVVFGAPTTVRAALRTAAGRGIPARRVALMARVLPSTTWRPVATAVTDASGVATLRAVLPGNAALMLRHVADAVVAGDVLLWGVQVRPRLVAHPSATTIPPSGTLVVRGGIARAQRAGQVVRLQRRDPRGWVTVASGRTTSPSTYLVVWRSRGQGSWAMRVVKPADVSHTVGATAAWRQRIALPTVAGLARAIEADPSIGLDRVHVSGVVDGATPAAEMVDLAAGRVARRSAYENAPGGTTGVDVRVLRAIQRMGATGSVIVTEIAGGSHAPGSYHYRGLAVDVRVVNGVPVRPGTAYGLVVAACRAYGATHVFYPAYDPVGGHQNHVHCDWG